MTPTTPTLQGFGVRLTPLTLQHVPALQATQDEATWRHMSESGATPALLAAFVRRAIAAVDAGTCQAWLTEILKANGIAHASGCTRLADLQPQHRTGEIGWTWIAPAYRGSGLNVRVKLLQLRHAFNTLRLRRVALKTHHANLASQRAILKLGAQYEGTFRNHLILPDGTSRDTVWYSIIEEEWPAVEQHLLQRIAQEPLLPRAAAGAAIAVE